MKPKNHHYVSRFLLKNFQRTDSKAQPSHVWTYDVATKGPSKSRAIKSVASKEYFYTEKDEARLGKIEDYAAKELRKLIEGDYSGWFAPKIVDGAFEMCVPQYDTSIYLALCLVRTTVFREFQQQFTQATLAELGSMPMEYIPSNDYMKQINDQLVNELMEVFGTLCWTVIELATKMHQFVTSDRTVSFMPYECSSWQIVFPFSPTHAILAGIDPNVRDAALDYMRNQKPKPDMPKNFENIRHHLVHDEQSIKEIAEFVNRRVCDQAKLVFYQNRNEEFDDCLSSLEAPHQYVHARTLITASGQEVLHWYQSGHEDNVDDIYIDGLPVTIKPRVL